MSATMALMDLFRCFNRRLALAVLLIALSTFNYGFDNQAFATTQAMNAFDRQFGVFDDATGTYILEPSWLSLFNSLNYIGFAAGVLVGSIISSRFGRRWCMFSMSCYALITATVAVTSKTREQIMAARVLNYLYVGMELAVVPVFQSEIVPRQIRGLVVGTYQLSLSTGGLVINLICFGTSRLPDNRAWRIPLGMFYIVPTIVLSLIWFIPESPRWLIRQDRVDEARENLQKLREGAFSTEEVDAEFNELRFAHEQEPEQGKFVELFKGSINRKRTGIVVGMNAFQQLTGQAFGSQYGAVYVKSLGTINPFSFNLILAGIGIVIVSVSLLYSDRVGRRPILLVSSTLMAVGTFIMGGLGTMMPVTPAINRGIVATLGVLLPAFQMGWAPLCYTVTTEVSSLYLRDHSTRLGFMINVICNFAVSFSVPYLLYEPYAALGSKLGFIFGSFAILSFAFVYFCVPECKGKTLEQVDLLFSQGIRLRDFGKTDGQAIMTEVSAITDKGLGVTHLVDEIEMASYGKPADSRV